MGGSEVESSHGDGKLGDGELSDENPVTENSVTENSVTENPDEVPGRDTETILDSEGTAPVSAIPLPGLTILYHPDFQRIGERALLPALGEVGESELSRHTPDFAPPGSHRGPRPLQEAHISRRPLLLRRCPNGTLRLERNASRTTVAVNGESLIAERIFPAEDFERGIVLLLGRRIVLLLHPLEPEAVRATPSFGMIGESSAMVRLRQDIQRLTDLRVPTLLRGETGTGKELVARAIHDAGPRREKPFIAINLGAIPPALAAAELFGATQGAFTGAVRSRQGHFARAHGGTLFLDEVGETPPEVQVQLLRCLENGEIHPLGAERPRAVDVRLISATDADLETAVREHRFRSPLLHRLSGFTLRLPPLRQRRDDLGPLLIHFLRQELEAVGEGHRLESSPDRPWLPAPLVAELALHSWPGNVRQLRNTVRQLVIAGRGSEILEVRDLRALLWGAAPDDSSKAVPGPRFPNPRVSPRTPDLPAPTPRKPSEIDQEELLSTLRAHRWRLQATADALRIPRSSLYDLIDKNPHVRKASELPREEIEAVSLRHGGHVAAMAEALEVSETALRRRLNHLRNSGKDLSREQNHRR